MPEQPDLVLPHRPAGLVVTPGASADRDHKTLVALDDGLPEITVVRLTLATTSVNRAADKVRSAVDELAQRLDARPDDIALGGRSFGGRACSVAVADGLPAAGLVLLSYPLHPPGKPDQLRTDHFDRITAPALFVSGRKDPFGSPQEFATHLPGLAGRWRSEWIDGNHAPAGAEAAIVALVRAFIGLDPRPQESD